MATIYDEGLPARPAGPGRVLGRGGRGHPLGPAVGPRARREPPPPLPVGSGGPAQHPLQPPRRARPPRPPQTGPADLRLPPDRDRAVLHLLRTAPPRPAPLAPAA